MDGKWICLNCGDMHNSYPLSITDSNEMIEIEKSGRDPNSFCWRCGWKRPGVQNA